MYTSDKNDNDTIKNTILNLAIESNKNNESTNAYNLKQYNNYINIIKRKLEPVLVILRHSIRLDSGFIKREGLVIDWSDSKARAYDPPLIKPEGIDLAIKTGIDIKNRGIIVNKIICSPLRRCIETAVEIAKIFNIKEIKIDYRVTEYTYWMAFNDKINDKITFIDDDEMKKLGGSINIIKPIDNSKESVIPKKDESYEDFKKRFFSVVDEEIDLDNKNIKDNRTLIVSHGSGIQSIHERINKDPNVFEPHVDFCAWIAFFKNSKIYEYGNIKKLL